MAAPSTQRSQFARKVAAGLPVISGGKDGIGIDHRPGGELAEHLGATGAIVAVPDMNELLPDRRRIGVVSRGFRPEDAEVDGDQECAEAIFGARPDGFWSGGSGARPLAEDQDGRALRRAGR